jgi:transcriptional regulator with XRE-family HTH domain
VPPPPVDGLARRWGARVAERRRSRGLSQADLALGCGVTQQTISKIERGEMIPLDRLKLALSSALEVHPHDLFPWPEPVAPAVSPC